MRRAADRPARRTGTRQLLSARRRAVGRAFWRRRRAVFETTRQTCPITIVTRSALGSLIATAAETVEVKAHPVAQVVDSTGAGDLYAAGFLFGYARDHDLAECGALAALAAAEVISHIGPRPEQSLRALALKNGMRV